MPVLLEMERLWLRRFTAVDADYLFALDNDPDVMRFINGGLPTPRTVIENDILPEFLRVNEAHPGFGFWAAIEKNSGAFIGWFSLRPTEAGPTVAALGYRLHRAAWGQGYAPEGARALMAQGFTAWGVQRVVATTYEHNLASRRVMEKLGMKQMRSFRLTPADLQNADTFHADGLDIWDGHDVEYALEKAEWLAASR